MYVIKEIKDLVYEKMIEYMFEKCDAVMFVSKKNGFGNRKIIQLEKTMELVKKELEKSFLKKRNGAHWVYSKIGYNELGISGYSDPPNFGDLFEIYFYKLSKETKEYLLTNKKLYNWLNPNYPEDIAFFKNGSCWFYSVTHEETCEIYYETDNEYQELINLGIEFDEKYILPKDKRYYEEY